jgi:hypothetical protein
MSIVQNDDIRRKAERYVHECIVAGGKVPSDKQRREAVDKIEKYTRELVRALKGL